MDIVSFVLHIPLIIIRLLLVIFVIKRGKELKDIAVSKLGRFQIVFFISIVFAALQNLPFIDYFVYPFDDFLILFVLVIGVVVVHSIFIRNRSSTLSFSKNKY